MGKARFEKPKTWRRLSNSTNRKYIISEYDFIKSYIKNKGIYHAMARELLGDGIEGSRLFNAVKNLPWWSEEKYPRRSFQEAVRKYKISEDQFFEAYEKHNGNYEQMSKELTGVEDSNRLFTSVKNLKWWSEEKYPRKGTTRKYFIEEERFKKLYEEYDGRYSDISKALGMPERNRVGILKQSISYYPWSHKYPSMDTNRKYFIEEEDFSRLYQLHDGNFAAIARDLGISGHRPGSLLAESIQNMAWAKKYPRRSSTRKYNISEDELALLYSKHNGNYQAMGRELGIKAKSPGMVLLQSISIFPWKDKYPSRESNRKYFINEEIFSSLYEKHKGNYKEIALELGMTGSTPQTTLFRSVENKPWFSLEKYPQKRREKSLTPKKKLNRGQYQNAVSAALASKIGINVPVSESDKEISDDADILLKDINDLSADGMSIDQIAEELQIERAIVKRALESKVKPNPKRKYYVSEEAFKESYEKHKGHYGLMGKELLGIDYKTNKLFDIVRNLSWFSLEKYPRKGSPPRKYNISEHEFKSSYEKHDGNYYAMEKELLGGEWKGKTLMATVENLPWFTLEKYPRKGKGMPPRKYQIKEEDFKSSYEKHNGNYLAIEKDLLGDKESHNILFQSIKNLPWFNVEKYPRKGGRKYNVSEIQFKDSYDKHNGNYSLMAKDILSPFSDGKTLFMSVKNLPWFSLEKYPRKRKEKSLAPKKKLNRGQYQNAVTMALASKIGMNIPIIDSDKEILDDADILLKDINDLSADGMSIDQIAEELQVERAIVKRALESKVKSNPKRKSNPTSTKFKPFFNAVHSIKSNPTFGEHMKKLSKLFYEAYDKHPEERPLLKKAKDTKDIDELQMLMDKTKSKHSKKYIAYKVSTIIDREEIKSNPEDDISENIKVFQKLDTHIYLVFNKSVNSYSQKFLNDIFEFIYNSQSLLDIFKYNERLDKLIESDKKLFDSISSRVMELYEEGEAVDFIADYLNSSYPEFEDEFSASDVKNIILNNKNHLVACCVVYLNTIPSIDKYKDNKQIFLKTIVVNPAYARNKIAVKLIQYVIMKTNIRIVDVGLTTPDGKKLKKYLNDNDIAIAYGYEESGKAFPKIKKPNPAKEHKRPSGDIVFESDDGRTCTIKKELKCYAVYPEGDQFKRIKAKNLAEAKKIAKRILTKTKSNPRVSSIPGFFSEVVDGIANCYRQLNSSTYGSDEFYKRLQIITWAQGALLNWPDNAFMTMMMINRLYDMKTPVKDMRELVVSTLKAVVDNQKSINSYIANLRENTHAFKIREVFDEKSKTPSYFSFMQERESQFLKDFFKLTQEQALIDYCNLLRYWIYVYPDKSHEIFNKNLIKAIINNQAPGSMFSQEIIITSEYVNDCYTDALPVIGSTKHFIEGLK